MAHSSEMAPSSLLLLLVAAVTVATGLAACSSDADCHLNGMCMTNACMCYKPWTGPQCAVLDVLPVQSGAQGYGMVPNVSRRARRL